MKKLFGGLNLTWPKLIIFAILAGIYTAVMALLPQTNGTSFDTIAVTFEVWILFGIIIIMNSKSNKDAALKCFVFFLISQPLVYLIQVPFSHLGWKMIICFMLSSHSRKREDFGGRTNGVSAIGNESPM